MQPTEQEILMLNLSQFLIKTFNTVSDEDILIVRSLNVWEHKGRKLTPDQIVLLKDEAKQLLNSALWKILKAEILWLAQVKGLNQSKTYADQISGKMMIYLTEVIDKRLQDMVK